MQQFIMDNVIAYQRRKGCPNKVTRYEVRDLNGLITRFTSYSSLGAFVGCGRTTVWRKIKEAGDGQPCFINDFEILNPEVPHAH